MELMTSDQVGGKCERIIRRRHVGGYNHAVVVAKTEATNPKKYHRNMELMASFNSGAPIC